MCTLWAPRQSSGLRAHIGYCAEVVPLCDLFEGSWPRAAQLYSPVTVYVFTDNMQCSIHFIVQSRMVFLSTEVIAAPWAFACKLSGNGRLKSREDIVSPGLIKSELFHNPEGFPQKETHTDSRETTSNPCSA